MILASFGLGDLGISGSESLSLIGEGVRDRDLDLDFDTILDANGDLDLVGDTDFRGDLDLCEGDLGPGDLACL